MPRSVTWKLAKFAVFAASAAASGGAWAASPDSTQPGESSSSPPSEPSFEITPFIGIRNGGSFRSGVTQEDLNLASSTAAAIAVNWQATEDGTQYELLYSRQKTDTGGSTPIDMKVEYLQLGGTAVIGDASSHVVPFAAGGFGAARFTPDAASLSQETRWAFNLGGGVRVPIAKHVRLRFEVRGYLTWLNGKSSLFCPSSEGATCAITGKGETLFQYEALGGVSVGF